MNAEENKNAAPGNTGQEQKKNETSFQLPNQPYGEVRNEKEDDLLKDKGKLSEKPERGDPLGLHLGENKGDAEIPASWGENKRNSGKTEEK